MRRRQYDAHSVLTVLGGHFLKRKMKEMMEERGLEWKQISIKSMFQLKTCPGLTTSSYNRTTVMPHINRTNHFSS